MFATARTMLISSAVRSRDGATSSTSPVPIGSSIASVTSPAQASAVPSSRRTSTPPTGSRSRISCTASSASSPGAAPASARSPIAASARTRSSAARRSEMSRPMASSSGPATVCTIPQLISPMNSVPSRRTPHASAVKRSGWSVAK